ncbi:CBS domain-containing protein [Vitiosangium sp. GDMCC 1.1324]|uniref:CBS domain-containing protein n=1 Tax=Vitiosangium sp. (strain GDMCC 1.1324) TaxID=2138576 RepID=UPI000D34975B|nr:CBS domain-containing protein [Vitiosangium sp. GDMCC 1.1324]PTL75645.1 CBS domain-containing protein [Vitiosangium sp. GDMCC 1.1324]
MQIVGELMTRSSLVTLTETQNLAQADEMLRLHRIRHLPVVRDGKLVGLVTHRDLLRAAAQRGGVDPAKQPLWASDVMVRDVRTVRTDTPAREAVRLMLDNKYGCLPVVRASGELVGIITEADLVRYAQDLIEDMDRRSLAAEYEA